MLCLVTIASHWVSVGVLWSSKLFRIATEAIEFRPLPQKLKSTETMEMDSSGLIPRGLRGRPAAWAAAPSTRRSGAAIGTVGAFILELPLYF
jgi:hypothetical protein